MKRTRLLLLASLALLVAGPARAQDEPSIPEAAEPTASHELESLVPELAGSPIRIEPGPRSFLHRFTLSPGFGQLGSERLFALRVAYNPNEWLAYEGTLGHNPGRSVHAVLHSLGAIVRRPFAGRIQPYLTAGYGMLLVFPGESINADPVTKNAITAGGGLEIYIRSDLALRLEVSNATVFGREFGREGIVTYNYLQETIGLSFYRTMGP